MGTNHNWTYRHKLGHFANQTIRSEVQSFRPRRSVLVMPFSANEDFLCNMQLNIRINLKIHHSFVFDVRVLMVKGEASPNYIVDIAQNCTKHQELRIVRNLLSTYFMFKNVAPVELENILEIVWNAMMCLKWLIRMC